MFVFRLLSTVGVNLASSPVPRLGPTRVRETDEGRKGLREGDGPTRQGGGGRTGGGGVEGDPSGGLDRSTSIPGGGVDDTCREGGTEYSCTRAKGATRETTRETGVTCRETHG